MASLPTHLVVDLQRSLQSLHEDARANLLASVRSAALTRRLQRLVETAIDRVRRRLMQPGLLASIRSLLRDAALFSAQLRASNIIQLFVKRDEVAQKLRVLQVRTSNVATRLSIAVRPYLAADDQRATALDLRQFEDTLVSFRTDLSALRNLVRTVPVAQLRQLHRLLLSPIYVRPNRLVSAGFFDFATKARRAIEVHLNHPLPARGFTAPVSSLPPIHEIRREIGTLPPLPAVFPQRRLPGLQPHLQAPATQPALRPIGTPSVAFARSPQFDLAFGGLAQSVPVQPLRTPAFAMSRSPIPDLDLPGPVSADPIIYEEGYITTTIEPGSAHTTPQTQPLLSPRMQAASSPRSVPLPLSPNSPRQTQGSPPNAARSGPAPPVAIRFYDKNSGQFLEWRPFHGWLWMTPHTLEQVKDYNNHIIRPKDVVTVVSSFVALDTTQRQAILDHVSSPSKAPAILRPAAVGDKLEVLRIFGIRDTAWLACIPVEGSKPGFVPLKATILQGNPPLSLPRQLPAPIHGSARSFMSTFRFLDARGLWRTANVTGVVQPFRISYHEILPAAAQPTTHQAPVKWLHFPFERISSLAKVATTEVIFNLRDAGRDRVVHLHFVTGLEATYFYEDVEHMRRITARLIQLHEDKKRRAAMQAEAAARGVPANSPALNGQATNMQGQGLSPFSAAFDAFDNDISPSPHLSQLGSPRFGPTI